MLASFSSAGRPLGTRHCLDAEHVVSSWHAQVPVPEQSPLAAILHWPNWHRFVLQLDALLHRVRGPDRPRGPRRRVSCRSVEERIAHATTVQTPLGLSQERMCELIRQGGKTPVERDTLYNRVERAVPA